MERGRGRSAVYEHAHQGMFRYTGKTLYDFEYQSEGELIISL